MVTIRDKDRGAKAAIARFKKAIPVGRVGVYGDLAAQKHKDSPRATVGQIAAAHEFGLGPPQRSWMRKTLETHSVQISRGLIAIGRAAVTGEGDPGQMMRQLVQVAAGWCKEAITAGIAPALGTISPGAKRYLKLKLARYPGATTPLIASSQFLGSIAGGIEGE